MQQCAEKGVTLSEAFRVMDDAEVSHDLRREIASTSEFDLAFDPKWWVRHEHVYYERFGI